MPARQDFFVIGSRTVGLNPADPVFTRKRVVCGRLESRRSAAEAAPAPLGQARHHDDVSVLCSSNAGQAPLGEQVPKRRADLSGADHEDGGDLPRAQPRANTRGLLGHIPKDPHLELGAAHESEGPRLRSQT